MKILGRIYNVGFEFFKKINDLGLDFEPRLSFLSPKNWYLNLFDHLRCLSVIPFVKNSEPVPLAR